MRYIIIFMTVITIKAFSQAPVIDSLLIDESNSLLRVFGKFGSASGEVRCDNVVLSMLAWSDTLIMVSIPDTGKGSIGPVIVEAGGLTSTPQLISFWEGTISNKHFENHSRPVLDGEALHLEMRLDLQSLLTKTATWTRSLAPSKKTWYHKLAASGGGFVPGYGSDFYYGLNDTVYQTKDSSNTSGFSGTVTFDPVRKAIQVVATDIRGLIASIHYIGQTGPVDSSVEYKSEYFANSFILDSMYRIIEASNFSGDWWMWDSSVTTGSASNLPVKIIALQFTPSIVAPIDGSTNNDADHVVLAWDSLPFISTYRIQLTVDSFVNKPYQLPQANSFIIDTIISATTLKLFPLAANTKYYWHIQGSNAEGEGKWSKTCSFFTASPANIWRADVHPASVSVYPNPCGEKLNVIFMLPEPSATIITLSNLSGNRVRTLAKGNFDGGRHEISCNLVGIPAAPYVLRLTTDSGEVAKLFIKH